MLFFISSFRVCSSCLSYLLFKNLNISLSLCMLSLLLRFDFEVADSEEFLFFFTLIGYSLNFWLFLTSSPYILRSSLLLEDDLPTPKSIPPCFGYFDILTISNEKLSSVLSYLKSIIDSMHGIVSFTWSLFYRSYSRGASNWGKLNTTSMPLDDRSLIKRMVFGWDVSGYSCGNLSLDSYCYIWGIIFFLPLMNSSG